LLGGVLRGSKTRFRLCQPRGLNESCLSTRPCCRLLSCVLCVVCDYVDTINQVPQHDRKGKSRLNVMFLFYLVEDLGKVS
jgi:hypothetical protein